MIGKTLQFVKTEWDSVIALLAALALMVIPNARDWKTSDETIASSIFAVLALLALTIVKGRINSDREAATVSDLRLAVRRIEDQVGASSIVNRVRPPDIGRRLGEACATTRHYRFKGGTGTYLRAETLPGLVRERTTRPIIWIEVIAPDDVELCDRYGRYRRRLASGTNAKPTGTPWTTAEVRIEAYATIVAAAWYQANRAIEVNIALSSTMSTFRYDHTDSFVIVTNEDPASTAMLITTRDGSSFHKSVEFELRTSFEQARKLDLSGCDLRSDEISAEDVRRVMTALGVAPKGDNFLADDGVCNRIALKAISAPHAGELGFPKGGAHPPYP